VTERENIPFVFSRTMFDAGHDPQTALVVGSARAALHASFGLPHGVLLGPPIASARFDDWSRDGALSSSIPVFAGDDFFALLPRVYLQTYARRRTLKRPDSTTPGHLDAETVAVREHVTPVPSGPNIGPAINLTIAEQPGAAGGRIRLTGGGPIAVDWITVATATQYELTVLRADDDAGTTRFVPVATLSSAASMLELPAEVFAGGTWFAFRLSVLRNGTLYADGRLRGRDFPYGHAQSVSGVFRVDATCGDGTPGDGEDCDPGDVETPACDLDCTIPLCGDGLRNAAANELCDTIADSFACDDDCTLPVCGDGHLNPNLEDCDDGNIPDTGNGCSTMCKANNVCGDSIVQDAVEECDPPGPTCTANCRDL
jgi:cysteine-rich repeat protein